MQKFLWGTNFQIKSTKTCTEEELVTAITVGYPDPQKVISTNHTKYVNVHVPLYCV